MSESRDVAMPEGLEVTRRGFLRLAAGLAGGVLTVSLASACASVAPTAGPTRPAPGPTTSGNSAANAVYPTYLPGSTGPKPDSPANGPGYDAGFDKVPTNPAKAMPGDPPGAGGAVNIMSISLFPPPEAVFSSAWNTVSAGLIASLTGVAFERLRAADQFTPDCSRRARRSHDGAGAPGAASLAAYRSALQTGRMLPPVAGGLATIVGFSLLHP